MSGSANELWEGEEIATPRKSFGKRATENRRLARGGTESVATVVKASAAVAAVVGAVAWLLTNGNDPAGPAATVTEAAEGSVAGVGRMWVTSDRLDLRSCPSESCGLSGRLMFRELAAVEEIDGEWGRVTRYGLAPCLHGRTSWLEGNNVCTADNGFVDGRFAQWVRLAHLSPDRPEDPGANATGAARLVARSQDFQHHEAAFVTAAQRLISSGICTEDEFLDGIGWLSSSDHRDMQVYFTFCGEMEPENRIYLDVSDGRLFR